MLTVRAAARLLESASSLDRCAPIAALAGCDGIPIPLDDGTRHQLGVTAGTASLAPGPGALRALLVEMPPRVALADELRRMAGRLTTRAAHVLWLVVATQPASGELAVAAWTGARRPPRVAALLVQRARIVDSDAETLALLASSRDGRDDADVLTHLRWTEVLGREALTRRFYRALERRVVVLASSLPRGSDVARREISLLYCSRLLFLAFLEAKGWLNGDRDFLVHGFDACMASGGGYHRRVLRPLFFGTLNTRVRSRAAAARSFGRVPFLNGGLFAPAFVERDLRGVCFPDDALGAVYADVFSRFRFTTSEVRADWVQAAVDPEMLGKAFESLMIAEDRKASGAFYTPVALVERVATAGLARALRVEPERCHASSLCQLDAARRTALRERLARLAVLDPACGSGAFLVHVLERIAALAEALGDERPVGAIRREVLTRSIFGVDRDPTAVWLCELRLWLSVVMEHEADDPLAVPPLPNLDRNVRVGDSLAGDGVADSATVAASAGGLRSLRTRYARATGRRKHHLARTLDREERRLALECADREIASVTALRRDLLGALRGHDLFGERHRLTASEREQTAALRRRVVELRAERRRIAGGGALPFAFAVHFADVAARGGFDLVLGNPPWVRVHRIPLAERDALRRRFRVFRAAAWESGAERAHAGVGFAAQVDLAALFVERSLRLLRPEGALALLVPVKLWHALAAGGVRRLLAEESRVVELEDFSEAPSAFDAAVYPSLVVAERWNGRAVVDLPGEIIASAHRRGGTRIAWRQPRATLAYDATPGSPWLVMPPDGRAAFDRVAVAGRPLAESAIGRPRLGVKCGFNLAFVVRHDLRLRDALADVVAANGRRGIVERALLRPALRGESLRAWRAPSVEEAVVWTHGPGGAPLERLPPHASHWLGGWRHQLAARADARGARWWTLFRVDAARSEMPRVVWADVGITPRAVVLRAGDPHVPLNSCYVALCRDEPDAFALTAILNSPLTAAWLGALAEPARGGYRRFLGWTMSLLPLPRDWQRAREILAPVTERALHDRNVSPPSADELLESALAAYRLRHRDVAPLLAWLSA